MKKPLMTIGLEEIDLMRHNGITERQVNWYEKGLTTIRNKITNEGIKFVDVRELLDIAINYLDGEPTTADKHNNEV
tara:strand:- start:1042 stop:1269 length:228 start_codon:yes stop_codon:yes gene_type:complete